jgi:DDE superfamily endonuclease
MCYNDVHRTKNSKNRVTVLLTCNATGCEKLDPLFIYKFKNPRSLNGKNKDNLSIDYYWNQSAWMQVSIWNDYLRKLDKKMHFQKRKILLLVDNAPVHSHEILDTLNNVKVEFFLPNTTSHLQPCDAGIIHSFKAQYKKLLVHNRIEAYETAQILERPIAPVTI